MQVRVPLAGQETCESRQIDQLEGKNLSNAFEKQCLRYMIEQHQLAQIPATRVASAFGKAPVDGTSNLRVTAKSKNAYFKKYAIMIDNCFMKSF